MFRVLSDEERLDVVDKYLKIWKNDIWKISSISYNGITEYLVNEHYLFSTDSNKDLQ